MPEKLKYVEIPRRKREDLENSFKSSDTDVICNALWSAAQHDQNWRWSQGHCLELLNHESLLARSVALMALGQIALFQGKLDLETVLPAIHHAANDPALASDAQDTLADIDRWITTNEPKR